MQSIPGPGEQPQTFETVEEVEARPEWNAIAASTTVPFVPAFGDRHAYLAGVGAEPEARRRLPARGWRRARRALGPAHPHGRHGRRRRRAHARHLGRAARLARSLRAAGRRAAGLRAAQAAQRLRPQRAPVGSDVVRVPRRVPGRRRRAAIGPTSRSRPPPGTTVDLDGSHPDVVPGSWVVLSMPSYRELWQVDHGERALAGRVRHVGQGHAARASRAARTTRTSATRSARPPCSPSASR